MSFLTALSVSHTFHDFLPAIFLGAPEAETALASLSGVEKAAKGEGIEAFHYTLFGGVFSIVVFIFMIPILFIGLESIYSFLRPFMEYILGSILILLVYRSKKLLSPLLVILMSGVLGVLAFSIPVNSQYVLVPVFSGLFALPAIITALSSNYRVPEQKPSKIHRDATVRGGILGCLSGIFTGIFPGVGPAVSTSLLTPLMDRPEDFLAAMGGVNSSDIIMTFISLYIIGKARSGASVALQAISKINSINLVFILGISFLSISFSVFLAYKSPRIFISFFRTVSVQKSLYLVILILLSVVYTLTGLLGILILFTSLFIGFFAALKDLRQLTISVLLLPSILFFSGLTGFI